MADYFAILTEIGKATVINAAAFGNTISLTHMAVGDGNGEILTPVADMTELVNEVHRAPINTLSVDPKNSALMRAELVIPADVGGWTVREVGAFDEAGRLFAVANFPDTYKPELAEGSGRELTIVLLLEVSDTGVVNLIIDPTAVLASRNYVDEEIAKITPEAIGAAAVSHGHEGLFYDPIARENNALLAHHFAALDAQTGERPMVDGCEDNYEDATSLESPLMVHNPAKDVFQIEGVPFGTFEDLENNGQYLITDQLRMAMQSFSLDRERHITKIAVRIKRVGNPTGNLELELGGVSGSAPNHTWANSVAGAATPVDVATIGTDYEWVEFVFPRPVKLGAGYHAMNVKFGAGASAADTGNAIIVGLNSSGSQSEANPNASGNHAYYYAGAWGAQKWNDTRYRLFEWSGMEVTEAALDTDSDGSWANYHIRQVIPASAIPRDGSAVILQLEAAPGQNFDINKVSIVERDGDTRDGTTVPTPVTYKGGRAINDGSSGKLCLDVTPFVVDASKDYLVCIDLGASVTKVRYGNNNWGEYEGPTAGADVQNMPDSASIRAERCSMVAKFIVVPTYWELVSSAVPNTPVADPSTLHVTTLITPIASIVLNTDFIVEVSRDGGTTWTPINLVEKVLFDTGKKVLTGEADLSAKPPGADPRYRIKCPNNKYLEVCGTILQWRFN